MAKVIESDKVNIRLPDGLRNRIKAAAAQNGRSLNNEIVVALLDRFPETPADVSAVLSMIEYIEGAEDDLDQFTRAAEIEGKLRRANPRARVKATFGKSVSIELEP